MRGPLLPLNCLLFSILSLFIQVSFAQSVQVFNSTYDEVISGVEIFHEGFDNLVITDQNGIALIDTTQNSVFHFSKESYILKSLSVSELLILNWKVPLSPFSEEIDEIVLIGQHSFKDSDKFHLTETITTKEIQKSNPQTSADILTQNGNVYVQKSQMGGGSPIIRGFEANRVLLVVDGVRMNNAIYRNGHLQNAITVDASSIENVKVLFGPNSLAYGSDAIGGVVSYTTKIPLFGTKESTKIKANALTRFSTANQEKTVHGDFSLGWEKLALMTSITITDYDDLRSGGNRDDRFPLFGLRTKYSESSDNIDVEIINPNPKVQIGTAYHQYDILQKVIFKPEEKIFLSANIQFSNTGNVPRYDNLQEITNGSLRYAEWNYGPQKRNLASLQLKNYNVKKWYDQYILLAAFQNISEERIVRIFQNKNRLNQKEGVNVFSFTGEFKKSISRNLSILYGFDSQFNGITSTAFTEDISNGAINDGALSRYANGDNTYSTYGLFSEIDWSNPSSLFSAKAGVRYSSNKWAVKYINSRDVIWPTSFINGVEGTNNALTWSVSGLYNNPSGFFIRGLISSAFRAPNIDDLSKIRVNANEITFPNTNLSPEKSLSSEISIGFKNQGFNFSATTFFTELKDAITRRPFSTPDGSSTYDNFGETLIVVGNQNAQKAHIYGLALNGAYNLTEYWNIKGSWNFTKGREKTDGGIDYPFAHIPPIYGNVRLSFEPNDISIQAVVNYNGAKDLNEFGGSVDNPDLATPVGSLGWTTFNIYGSYNFSKNVSTTIGLENITDLHYRTFGSGVSAAGRNVILSVRYSI
tara:strand:- start:4097 stop:6529 length:2433 start_codon:yes stop_codon:yes gene_type:complete